MRKIIALAAIAATAACAAEPMETTRMNDDEARLAAELRDYEQVGPAESCVSLRQVRGNHSVGERAIVFEGLGGRIWVNRPRAGCPDLRHTRALRTETTTSQLCRGDIATIFDPANGIEFGACGLGEFTPYRRREG